MLYQCMPLGEPHTHIWAYMPLSTSISPGSPTEYSMDTYSILQQVNFQGLRCVTYTLAERAFNFPNMAFFETKSKTGTKCFRIILETFDSRQCMLEVKICVY